MEDIDDIAPYMETTSKYLQFVGGTFLKLEFVSRSCLGFLMCEHPIKNHFKYGIPRPNGNHQWIRAEVLPLESVLQVWKGPLINNPKHLWDTYSSF